eukprot:499351-Pelagomonas_calceolata.AAC.1
MRLTASEEYVCNGGGQVKAILIALPQRNMETDRGGQVRAMFTSLPQLDCAPHCLKRHPYFAGLGDDAATTTSTTPFAAAAPASSSTSTATRTPALLNPTSTYSSTGVSGGSGGSSYGEGRGPKSPLPGGGGLAGTAASALDSSSSDRIGPLAAKVQQLQQRRHMPMEPMDEDKPGAWLLCCMRSVQAGRQVTGYKSKEFPVKTPAPVLRAERAGRVAGVAMWSLWDQSAHFISQDPPKSQGGVRAHRLPRCCSGAVGHCQ